MAFFKGGFMKKIVIALLGVVLLAGVATTSHADEPKKTEPQTPLDICLAKHLNPEKLGMCIKSHIREDKPVKTTAKKTKIKKEKPAKTPKEKKEKKEKPATTPPAVTPPAS